jgi:glycerol uptake facilitator-like aquaporin
LKNGKKKLLAQVVVKSLIMEFIGTFSLVFVGGWSMLAAENSNILVSALSQAAVYGIMIYVGA